MSIRLKPCPGHDYFRDVNQSGSIGTAARCLVVDDDAVVCRELARLGVPVMRGDGSDKETLDRAGANRAVLVIASMRRAGDALKVLEHVRDVPVVARVFEADEAEIIRAAGGIPVLNSEAAADTFMAWFLATDRISGSPRDK